VRVSLIFAIIVSFVLFTVFPLVDVLYFGEFLIHYSRGFHDFEENLTESVGPVLFSGEYLICRHVQTTDGLTDGRTDGRTHGRINLGGLGNLVDTVPPGKAHKT